MLEALLAYITLAIILLMVFAAIATAASLLFKTINPTRWRKL